MEEMTHELAITRSDRVRGLSRSVTQGVVAAFAIVLGATIVFAIGFAPNDFLHGAAHDVRHASGFPCH